MKRKIALLLVFGTMLVGSLQMIESASAQGRLTLAMILTGLQTKGSTPETSTLAKRNLYIQRKVDSQGVTFRLTPDIETELRNAGATLALIAAIRRAGPAAPTPEPDNSSVSSTVNRVWVDYNITQGGELGMLLHVNFEVTGLKGVDSRLAVRVQTEDGDFLEGSGSNSNDEGQLSYAFEMKPGYATTAYKDATVFIPYSDIVLPKGKHNLKLDIDLQYGDGELIEHLEFHAFVFTSQGQGPTRPDPASVSTTVNRVWVDYNITQNGQLGMLIHVDFEVTGLKGVGSRLAIRVAKDDQANTYLMNSGGANSNDAGQTQVSFEMKPGYETTVYKDATVFLPYSDIKIAKGKWNLKLDIDLQFEDGTGIKHLYWHPFQFTQR